MKRSNQKNPESRTVTATNLNAVRATENDNEKDRELGSKDKCGNALSAVELDKENVRHHLQDALDDLVGHVWTQKAEHLKQAADLP